MKEAGHLTIEIEFCETDERRSIRPTETKIVDLKSK